MKINPKKVTAVFLSGTVRVGKSLIAHIFPALFFIFLVALGFCVWVFYREAWLPEKAQPFVTVKVEKIREDLLGETIRILDNNASVFGSMATESYRDIFR